MTLYIQFGYLYKFHSLYNGSEFLQSVATNITGIKWEIDEDYRSDIECYLADNNIIYDIE